MWKKLVSALPLALLACAEPDAPSREVIEERACLPKQEQACNQIRVTYPKFSQAWLNRLLEAQMIAPFSDDERQEPPTDFASTIKKLIEIKQDASEFFPSEYSLQTVIYGENADFLSLVTYSDFYQMGMAHGMPGIFPVMIDKNKKQALRLPDILQTPAQAPALAAQQKAAWIQTLLAPEQDYTEKFNSEAEAQAFVQEWGFSPSDYWRLAHGGLIFQFQPYQLCPYVCGMPEVFVPADKLVGIIRADILKASETWQDRKENEINEELDAPDQG